MQPSYRRLIANTSIILFSCHPYIGIHYRSSLMILYLCYTARSNGQYKERRDNAVSHKYKIGKTFLNYHTHTCSIIITKVVRLV